MAAIVTLKNMLDQIFGPVQDEFDQELPPVIREVPASFIVQGGTHIGQGNEGLNTDFIASHVDF